VSTQALAGATGMPADELAVAQRVQQIQALVEQAGQAYSPASGTPSASFAATLQAASAAGAPSAGYGNQAGAVSASGYTPGALASGGSYPQAAGATGSAQYDPLVNQAAARYGLDPAILHGLIQQESGFDPNATSGAGAVGLTQLMPATATSLGVTDPTDPTQSIEGGARYLSQMMTQFGGDPSKALAAYNAGPGAVQRYGGIPPYTETQSYVAKVLAYADAYRQNSMGASTPGGIA
jgi:soluble lytic murein transglycosylase-like protein